jgi:hypothetical protein
MARIARWTQKIFASLATNNGQFGSAQTGTKVESSSLTTLQALPAFDTGWLDAVLGAREVPPLEEFQALDYINTTQLAYLFQEGVPAWDSGTTYFTNSWVKLAGSNKIYVSLQNDNINHLVTDIAWWKLLVDFDISRTALSAPTTFYVATTGNNVTGNGTIGAPWQTIQFAYEFLQRYYDTRGYNVTIQCADGTYTAGLTVSGPLLGGGVLQLTGNTTTPANCIITATSSDCFSFQYGANIALGGFKCISITSGYHVNCGNNATVDINGKMEYAAVGAGSAVHIYSHDGGRVNINANYTISAGTGWHWNCISGGLSVVGTITLTGTPAFSNAFAQTTSIGYIGCGGVTFSGAATGIRYSIASNSVINTAAGGATFLPGNAGGSAASGGQYI